MSAAEIVQELARLSSFDVSPLDGWQIDSWCLFCEAKHTYDKENPTAHHDPACLWRRAVEFASSDKASTDSTEGRT